MSWLWGLGHVRRLWLGVVLSAGCALATTVWYDAGYTFQVRTDAPARGLNLVEPLVVVLAAVLPALCLPAFDGRERLATPRARAVHTAVSGVLFLTGPLVVFLAWYAAVRWQVPSQRLPSPAGFVGNLVLAVSVGLVSTLALGRALGPLVAVLAYVAGLVGQQMAPDSVVSLEFSRGDRWHTNWWLSAVLVAGALLADHARHSVPRREG